MSLAGYSNGRIAAALEIDDSTVPVWAERHKEFGDALKAGRDLADGRAARALFRRVTGFRARTEKIFCDTKTGEIFRANTLTYYPPDVQAAMHWLKKRQPELWGDVDPSSQPSGVNIYIDADTLALCGKT